jgi:uncharacterized protein
LRVTGTAEAERVVEQAMRDRRGALVFTIGTGCCESTAPFLYEDFWPGPDSEAVGEVAGVPVYAPAYLRALYPGSEGVTVDVEDSMAESMSIETEYGCRFILRAPDGVPVANQRDTTATRPERSRARSRPMIESQVCDVPEAVSALRPRGRQELPEALRRARIR